MDQFVRVVNGVAVEIISSAKDDKGQDIAIEKRFHPDFLAGLVKAKTDVAIGSIYDGKKFVSPTPSASHVFADRKIKRDSLMSIATFAMGPIQDAIDLGQATAGEKKLLDSWKKYRIALNRLDLNAQDIAWPDAPSN